jgi:KDO2-lipid IV(A) lauroyltransferase
MMLLYRAISWLPFPILYAAAWVAYLLLYYVVAYRKEVVRKNLSMAFPDKSEREITVLGKKFYRQFTDTAFEIVKARRMSKEDFRRRVKLVNPELLQSYSNQYQDSVIITTIHQGNWEWMLHGAVSALNIPIDPVYKPLHDKTTDKLIFDIRSQFGSRPLPMAESVKDIIRRRKEFRLFIMVADQSPTRQERCLWTTFMNGEAAFYLGSEILAKMTRFPVLFVQCRRPRRGHYEIEFHEIAKPPYDKASHEITHRFVSLAEMAIRSEPESWLWTNRRWKRDRRAEEAREADL